MSLNQFFLFYGTDPLLFQNSLPSENDLSFLLGFFSGDGSCCQQTKDFKTTTEFSYRNSHRKQCKF